MTCLGIAGAGGEGGWLGSMKKNVSYLSLSKQTIIVTLVSWLKASEEEDDDNMASETTRAYRIPPGEHDG